MNNWQAWDPSAPLYPTSIENGGTGQGQQGFNNLSPEWLKSIGFNGPATTNGGDNTDVTNPALAQWLQSKGYALQNRADGMNSYGRLVDGTGSQVGDQTSWQNDPDNAFGLAMLAAGGFAGAAAGGAFAGSGAFGTGAAPAGGAASSGGLAGTGLPEYAGYQGAGSAGTLVAGPGGAGVGEAAGTAASDAAGMGLAEGAYPASITAGGGGGGLLGTGVTLADLGGYASTASKFAPLLGAVLGSTGSLSSATQSTQNKLDPRIAQYLYGANGTTGLLGNVGQLYNQQMATGGLNPLQQQGIAAQQQVLNDPGYQTGFNQMRQAGQGLLNQPMAGNPFTTGQASLMRPRMQIPQAPGLLGSK